MSLRFIKYTVTNRNALLSQANTLAKKSIFSPIGIRALSKHAVNKNFELVSSESFVPSGANKSIKRFKDESKPLVVMLTWLLARKKHVAKYCDIYLNRGYNVITVSVTPWQFFWPLNGTQPLAEDLLKYLNNQSENTQNMIVHGFSIGGYLWGEVLVKMNTDMPKYSNLVKSIKGQIWDSPADVTETTKGLPQAMFPRNAFLRSTMEKYVRYHLKTFYDAATQHYLRASQFYHSSPIRCPALFFVSKNDLIGSVIASSKAKEAWDSLGMKTYWQCWENSPHVSHYMVHKEEYLNALNKFLTTIENSEEEPQKIKAKI